MQKILKLRSQDEFFSNEVESVKENGSCIVVKRGNSYILFNF